MTNTAVANSCDELLNNWRCVLDCSYKCDMHLFAPETAKYSKTSLVGYGRKVNCRQSLIALLLSHHVHYLISSQVCVHSSNLIRFWSVSFLIAHSSSLPWTTSEQKCNQRSASSGTIPSVQPSLSPTSAPSQFLVQMTSNG